MNTGNPFVEQNANLNQMEAKNLFKQDSDSNPYQNQGQKRSLLRQGMPNIASNTSIMRSVISLEQGEYVENRWHSPTLMINQGIVKGELIKTVQEVKTFQRGLFQKRFAVIDFSERGKVFRIYDKEGGSMKFQIELGEIVDVVQELGTQIILE